jgi:hypothetical protein
VRKGHALLAAIVVLLLVASAAALLASHLSLKARLVSQETRRIHLVALSDAAMAAALAELAAKSSFRGHDERAFGDGLIASRVRSLPDDQAEVTAVATYRGWRRQTRALVALQPSGPVLLTWSVLPPGAGDR